MSEAFVPLYPLGGAVALSATDVAATVPTEPREDRPFIVVNMIATLDGRITVDGRSGPIANRADNELFHALRDRMDGILVGAGTVRAEGYGALARPVLVVSRSLDLDPALPLLADPGNDVVIITPSPDGELPPAAARVRYLRAPDLRGGLVLARSELGLSTLVCEGGPRLNATLFPAGLADELHLVLASRIVDGPDPLTIVAGTPLRPPLDATLLSVHESGGYLFLRYAL